MRLVLASVGQRPPAWAETAYEDFAKRFPPDLRLDLKAVKAEPRTTGKTAAQMMAAEALRLEAAVPKGARRVVLDEHGSRLTTRQLADRLNFWLGDGRDVVLTALGGFGFGAAVHRPQRGAEVEAGHVAHRRCTRRNEVAVQRHCGIGLAGLLQALGFGHQFGQRQGGSGAGQDNIGHGGSRHVLVDRPW